MSRHKIILLALATLIIMGGLGFYLTPLTRDQNIFDFLKGIFHWFYQIILGIASGWILAFIGWRIIKLPFSKPVRDFFTNLISNLELTLPQIIFISFCAGVGEEFLFRGAIQPLLGIWVTSIIFVFIHGYLNPLNYRLFVYGIFMTFAIAIIGYITEYVGIISSMLAHTVIDIYLLRKLSNPSC